MNLKTYAVGILALSLTAFFCGCSYFLPGKSSYRVVLPPEAVQSGAKFDTQKVGIGTVEKSRQLYSKFTYGQTATFTVNDQASRRGEGLVISASPDIYFQIGQKVKTGQKVAQIKSNIDDVIAKLRASSTNSPQQGRLAYYDTLKSSFVFYAPFDGEIVSVHIPVASQEDISDFKLEFANPDTLRFACAVPADQYQLFKTGEKGEIVIDTSRPDDPNHGRDIKYGGEVISVPAAGGGEFICRITSDYDPGIVKNDTAATFKIVSEKKDNVIAIPKSAVQFFGNKAIAGVMVNGCRVDREIQVGLTGDSTLEVIKGLSVGEVIAFAK